MALVDGQRLRIARKEIPCRLSIVGIDAKGFVEFDIRSIVGPRLGDLLHFLVHLLPTEKAALSEPLGLLQVLDEKRGFDLFHIDQDAFDHDVVDVQNFIDRKEIRTADVLQRARHVMRLGGVLRLEHCRTVSV